MLYAKGIFKGIEYKMRNTDFTITQPLLSISILHHNVTRAGTWVDKIGSNFGIYSYTILGYFITLLCP